MLPASFSEGRKLKIVALRIDPYGTGHYRVTHPLIALETLGHQVSIIQAEKGLRINSHQLVCDILILQRQSCPGIYDCLKGMPSHLRPITVYETDDLIWNLSDAITQNEAEANAMRREIPPMLQMADAVICSTPELASEAGEFNPNVHVLLNAIDFGNRDWTRRINRPPEAEGKVVIGWSGSGWHSGDLDVIGKALRWVLLNHSETHFIGQGDAPNLCQWLERIKLPRRKISVVDWMPFETHPSVYSLFDIGIAPLASNCYNRCKSELKLMELGAWGIPYVASNVSPYRRFHLSSNGQGGLLARTHREWELSLECLLEREVREKLGAINKKFVESEYSLMRRGLEYEALFQGMIARRKREHSAAV
jgi:glycosyltransferase involved in cell wall biosynthesis